jgi:hypothetical protein
MCMRIGTSTLAHHPNDPILYAMPCRTDNNHINMPHFFLSNPLSPAGHQLLLKGTSNPTQNSTHQHYKLYMMKSRYTKEFACVSLFLWQVSLAQIFFTVFSAYSAMVGSNQWRGNLMSFSSAEKSIQICLCLSTLYAPVPLSRMDKPLGGWLLPHQSSTECKFLVSNRLNQIHMWST